MCCTQAKSPLRVGGQAGKGAAPRVVLPDLPAPLLQREGRVGDDAVEGRETAGRRVGEDRVAQGVAALDDEVLDAVEQQVHARHRGGGQVLLLAIELAEEGPRIAAAVAHVGHRASSMPPVPQAGS